MVVWWCGSWANHIVCMAQLIINDKNYGVHGFIIRSEISKFISLCLKLKLETLERSSALTQRTMGSADSIKSEFLERTCLWDIQRSANRVNTRERVTKELAMLLWGRSVTWLVTSPESVSAMHWLSPQDIPCSELNSRMKRARKDLFLTINYSKQTNSFTSYRLCYACWLL